MVRSLKIASAIFWTILTLPWVYFVVSYLRDDMTYGQFIHVSGDVSAWLLMILLALTPARLMFPRSRWVLWSLQRRRNLGVASFAYATAHVVAYLARQPAERILREAIEPGMAAGWMAMAIFLPLAVTSNDWAVRALGPRWKSLHRAVYVGAVLMFAHWVMTAFDPTVGAVHLAVLALILGYRVWKTRQRRAGEIQHK